MAARVTLGEGGTPLVESVRHAGLSFKLESTNPSGSYKDRFIARELEHVLAAGKRVCVATSSGNTGSSLAAYCARYGVRCAILVNADAPSGKLLQMQAHGARLVRIRDFVTRPDVTQAVFAELSRFVAECDAALIVSAFRYCPVGMQGVKTIAAELPPVDHVFVPVGSGGLFAAISGATPARVHAVQPEGCPTLLNAVRTGVVEPVTSTTRVSGLSVPFDIDGTLALSMLQRNHGQAFGVSDTEVFAAQREMLLAEGIYAEPAGAAALAGYHKARAAGVVRDGETSVAIVSGHGFKDPASLRAEFDGVDAGPEDLARVLRELTR